ncbi:MAG: imidazolonepropionase, partial [Hyphomicrobiaceae bacterium]
PGLGIIESGAIHADAAGNIAWIGAVNDMPASREPAQDLSGRLVTPGLIDCHTHLVWAGNRADEFEMRLAGRGYAEISAAGGGIVSTVKATRAASEAEIVALAAPRARALMADGVTTIEVKSGYGLDTGNEMKQLRAARALPAAVGQRVDVVATFLGAHALPPEAKGDKDRYIDLVVNEMIPAVAREKLADAVDAFMEGIAFSAEQTARVFDAAKKYRLPVKLHADQLSDLGGAALAAKYGALSADHLEYTDEAGAIAMAKAGTVAVILPGAYYFLRESRKPPIDFFRKHGAAMAVASDANAGSSPILSLRLAMNMACILFHMTVEEAILGVTRNAAKALGRSDIGMLKVGAQCNLAVWDSPSPAALVYEMGPAPLHNRVFRGITDQERCG